MSLTDQPDRLGPYVVLNQLGRGGVGVVFSGVHPETDQRVALKVVHLDRSRHRWFRREVAALSRLEHPQIVRVLDRGEDAGWPWFAMELVEGPPLSTFAGTHFGSRDSATSSSLTFFPEEAALDEDWTVDIPSQVDAAGGRLPEALELVRKLCAPLAFLHGEGMVHRDLKPDNVLLRDEQLPVLVDFGLASAFAARGREALDFSALRAGTPPYMAPEQIRGDPVDARADLYALGCILYELVTGRTPFVGLREAVLRAHLTEDPEPPSKLVAGVPEGLDALCLALLAKDPARRVPYATDVERALTALLEGDATQPAGPRPRPYLYRPRITGRRQVLDRVFGALREGPCMVLLTGEGGLGKTRLAELVGRRWALHGRTVIAATATRNDAPLAPWRGALEQLARRLERAPLVEIRQTLGPHGEVLGRFEESLAGWLEEGTLDRPPLAPQAEHLRVLRAMTHALDQLARRKNPLVVLDDLHWADPLSIDVIVWAVRHGLSLRLLATCRPDQVPAELAQLIDGGQVHVVPLSPLEPDDVRRMAAKMLAVRELAAPIGDWVQGLSEGRPYAVSEALRSGVADGYLVRDSQGAWVLDDPNGDRPTTIEQLVQRRLAAVAPADRPVLEAAAVLGRDLTASSLGNVLGLSEDDAVAAIGPLLGLDILELRPSGALGWAHDRLWTAGRAQLPPERLTALHRAAARALETEGLLGAVGSHLEAAGDRWPAARAHAAAARAALKQSAVAEADARFVAAIALTEPDDGAPGLRIAVDHATRVLSPRGENAAARACLEDALPRARALGDDRLVAECLDGLARFHGMASEPALQLRFGEEAAEVWTRVGELEPLARARLQVAVALDDLGRRDEAEVLLERILEDLQGQGRPLVEAECRANLGLHYIGEGHLELALKSYEAARRIAEAHGARALLGRVLTNLASLSWRMGDLGTAIQRLQQSLAVHRAQGARHSEGITLSNLAVGFAEQGRHGEALEMFREALAIDREVLNRRSEAWDLCELSDTELELGHIEDARQHAAEAVQVAQQVAEPYVLAHVLLHLVRLERQLDGKAHTPHLDALIEAAATTGRHSQELQVLAERGHQALCAGQDAEPLLAELERRLAERSADAQAQEAVAILEAAIEAQAGGTAIHGEAPEHLPSPLRP